MHDHDDEAQTTKIQEEKIDPFPEKNQSHPDFILNRSCDLYPLCGVCGAHPIMFECIQLCSSTSNSLCFISSHDGLHLLDIRIPSHELLDLLPIVSHHRRESFLSQQRYDIVSSSHCREMETILPGSQALRQHALYHLDGTFFEDELAEEVVLIVRDFDKVSKEIRQYRFIRTIQDEGEIPIDGVIPTLRAIEHLVLLALHVAS